LPRSLTSDAALAFILKLSGTGILFALSIYISRNMGASHFGVFSLFISLLLPLSVLVRMGLDNNLLRLISRDTENKTYALCLFKQSISAVAYVSLLGSFCLLVSWWLISTISPHSNISVVLPLLAVALPVHAILLIIVFFFRGKHWIMRSMLHENVLVYLFTLLYLLFFKHLFGQYATAAGIIVGTVAACMLAWLHVINADHGEFHEKADDIPTLKERFAEAFPMLGTSLATIAFGTLDVFLLSFYVGYDELGYYSAAAKLAAFVGFPLIAIISMIGPRLSQADANNEINILRQIFKRSTRMAFWSGFPVLLLIVFFPGLLLSMFGQGYDQAVNVIRILLAGQLITLMIGPVGYLLWMTGYAAELQKVTFYALAVAVAGSLVLIPLLKIEGAAIAFSLAGFVKIFGGWWLVRKHLGFNPIYLPGESWFHALHKKH
jgi:O-antigen/teichoic acid export membrane protein